MHRISPSSAIFTSTPGIGLPTVPNLKKSGCPIVITGLVSVKPYPSIIEIPIPQKNDPTSFDSADPPDEQALTLPPNAALNLFKTNLSAILYFNPKRNGRFLLCCLYGTVCAPTLIDHSASVFLIPVISDTVSIIFACIFSKILGTAVKNVGRTSLIFSNNISGVKFISA